MDDNELHELPHDFDINESIPVLREQFKKIPLSMYFHNLVLRLENEMRRKSGCECHCQNDNNFWIILIIIIIIDLIILKLVTNIKSKLYSNLVIKPQIRVLDRVY